MRISQLSVLIAVATIVAACAGESESRPATSLTAPSSRLGTLVTKVPGDHDPGPPYYAIAGNGGFVPHTDAWAAIPFDRRLWCVRAGANLLTLDVPAAFGCELTVSGHAHWETGPGIDIAPRQTQLSGSAVPIVFASWSQVQAAIADGVLTLAELLALPSARIGTASQYTETDIFGISGPLGPGRGMYKISARGSFSNGAPFSLHVNEVLGELRVVEITF